MIDWCNQNQGFAMVLLTFVYVVATIAICFFNYKSAEATKEQTKESRRQFNESNRAYITLTTENLKNGLITLSIKNVGNKIAKNVKIGVNQEFIESLKDDIAKQSVVTLTESSFDVGVGKEWHVFLGTHLTLKSLSTTKMIIDIEYEDDTDKYKEQRNIDLSQYFWALLNDSVLMDIRDCLQKQSKAIVSIDKNIGKISGSIEKKDVDNTHE